MFFDFNRRKKYDSEKQFNEPRDNGSENNNQNEKPKGHSISVEECKILQEKFVEEKSKLNISEKVDEAHKLIVEKRIDEAYKILNKLCSDFEKGLTFENTEEYSIFSFLNNIEFIAYIFDKKRDSHIEYLDSSYYRMYKFLGYVLIDLNDFTGAEKALLKAKRWNPISADLNLELADIELRKGDIEQAINLLKKALKFSTKADDMAHSYRKLGYCYTELQNYKLAIALYLHSLILEDNGVAKNELLYIQNITKNKVEIPSERKVVESILNENGIPLQASDLIIAAYIKFLQMFEDNNDKENFRFYFEEMKKMITKKEMLEPLKNLSILKD